MARAPGAVPPGEVVAALKRFHPTVQLRWDTGLLSWCLTEKSDFGFESIIIRLRKFRGAAERPTLANTVWYLDKHDVRRHANAYAFDRWLQEVDAAGPHDEIKRSEALASDRVAEGADRMWRVAGKRIPFAVKPDDHAAHSPKAGGPSPSTDGGSWIATVE